MRTEFAATMVALFQERPDLVFLTGDLGYMALEEVAQVFGSRFVNVGVAEQNAVSVAAGLCVSGQLPWVYSMAAFTTLRPYAQIRDNVCLHRLPVKLVGNGGGFGYGIMGATHHALGDIAAMRALPSMRVYVPLTNADIVPVIQRMAADPLPNYLRLNRSSNLLGDVPPFAPWRRLKKGNGCVVVSTGPIAESLYDLGDDDLFDELDVWSVGVFPFEAIPRDLAARIERLGHVITLEEHYGPGGLGESFGAALLAAGIRPRSFTAIHAEGYPSGRYGSQCFHQEENGLRAAPLYARLKEVLRV